LNLSLSLILRVVIIVRTFEFSVCNSFCFILHISVEQSNKINIIVIIIIIIIIIYNVNNIVIVIAIVVVCPSLRRSRNPPQIQYLHKEL